MKTSESRSAKRCESRLDPKIRRGRLILARIAWHEDIVRFVSRRRQFSFAEENLRTHSQTARLGGDLILLQVAANLRIQHWFVPPKFYGPMLARRYEPDMSKLLPYGQKRALPSERPLLGLIIS